MLCCPLLMWRTPACNPCTPCLQTLLHTLARPHPQTPTWVPQGPHAGSNYTHTQRCPLPTANARAYVCVRGVQAIALLTLKMSEDQKFSLYNTLPTLGPSNTMPGGLAPPAGPPMRVMHSMAMHSYGPMQSMAPYYPMAAQGRPHLYPPPPSGLHPAAAYRQQHAEGYGGGAKGGGGGRGFTSLSIMLTEDQVGGWGAGRAGVCPILSQWAGRVLSRDLREMTKHCGFLISATAQSRRPGAHLLVSALLIDPAACVATAAQRRRTPAKPGRAGLRRPSAALFSEQGGRSAGIRCLTRTPLPRCCPAGRRGV